MQSISQQQLKDDRKILNILFEIVNKYSQKQEEKTICKEEEVLIRSIYRDFFDSDIFRDFDLLYKDECFIVNVLQETEERDPDSFKVAVQKVTDYISQEENKREIEKIATKYKKKNKYEWIFTQAVTKINTYTSKLNDDECIRGRAILLNLIISILEFELKAQ